MVQENPDFIRHGSMKESGELKVKVYGDDAYPLISANSNCILRSGTSANFASDSTCTVSTAQFYSLLKLGFYICRNLFV